MKVGFEKKAEKIPLAGGLPVFPFGGGGGGVVGGGGGVVGERRSIIREIKKKETIIRKKLGKVIFKDPPPPNLQKNRHRGPSWKEKKAKSGTSATPKRGDTARRAGVVWAVLKEKKKVRVRLAR